MLDLPYPQRFHVQVAILYLTDHREKQFATMVAETLFLEELFLI